MQVGTIVGYSIPTFIIAIVFILRMLLRVKDLKLIIIPINPKLIGEITQDGVMVLDLFYLSLMIF